MLCPEEHLDSWNICSMINQKYIDDLNIFIMRCCWQNKRRYLTLLGSAGTSEVVETGVPERNPHQGCSFPVASTNLLLSSNSGFTSKLADDRCCWWIIQLTLTFPGDLYAAVCICRGSPNDHIHTGLSKPLFIRNGLPHLPGAGWANKANS